MAQGALLPLTFEYETGGVGEGLLEKMIVWLVTVPLISKPATPTHFLRVLLESPSRIVVEGDLKSLYTYRRIRSTMSSELGATWGPRGVIVVTPRREAAPSGSDDGISSQVLRPGNDQGVVKKYRKVETVIKAPFRILPDHTADITSCGKKIIWMG